MESTLYHSINPYLKRRGNYSLVIQREKEGKRKSENNCGLKKRIIVDLCLRNKKS